MGVRRAGSAQRSGQPGFGVRAPEHAKAQIQKHGNLEAQKPVDTERGGGAVQQIQQTLPELTARRDA